MLKFIHIPKTAGTSIEDFFKKHKILYGRFDRQYHANRDRRYLTFNDENPEPWHTVIKSSSDLWQNNYFFTVIRNPKDRLISEYYHRVKFAKRDKFINHEEQTITEFNRNISKILKKVNSIHLHRLTGHFAPQINFIDFNHLDKIFLLNFDNISVELKELHKKFKIKCPDMKTHNMRGMFKKFKYNDLDTQNRKLYNEIYALDEFLYDYVSGTPLPKPDTFDKCFK